MDTPSGEDATMSSRWYPGEAVVHIKVQALPPSTPLRHTAELLTSLQLENREDVKVRTQCDVYICPYACTCPYAFKLCTPAPMHAPSARLEEQSVCA